MPYEAVRASVWRRSMPMRGEAFWLAVRGNLTKVARMRLVGRWCVVR